MQPASVLVDKITKQIQRYAPYPGLDIVPIEGLDPNLEWLIQHIPYSEPDYDSRIYVLVTNYPDLQLLDSFPDHPLYPGLKEYRITYSTKKRDNDEIIISIDNRLKQANDLIWSEGEHKDKQLLMFQASVKASSGAILNEYEQSLLDEMNDVAVKLSKNMANRDLLVAQVIANHVPNIDLGWESVE